MRRIISFVFAVALVVAGASWAVHMWLYAERLYGKVLLAPVFMMVVGAIWLYSDFIDATPDERR